jgi:presenilin-like A22 family membrane protease
MERRTRTVLAGAGVVALFSLVQVGALALVGPFLDAGATPVEGTADPAFGLVYFVGILVASAVTLLAFRYGLGWVIRALVVLTSVSLSWFVLLFLLPPVRVAGVHVPALAGGLALGVALYVHPRWYVLDTAGVLVAAGTAGLFGITFGVLPALLLLAALTVYDAVSVYRTGHMLALAETAIEQRMPVLFVVPTRLDYSLADDAAGGGDGEGESDALFVGLGDAVMPTILVASAATLDVARIPLGSLPLTVPAAGGMVGTLAGLVVLIWVANRGGPQAGLPFLNGGAVAGYLAGALLSGLSVVEALGLSPWV